MKDFIQQQILDLDAKLADAQAQYQAQLDTTTEVINKKKCILYMALQSPVEINSLDEIEALQP